LQDQPRPCGAYRAMMVRSKAFFCCGASFARFTAIKEVGIWMRAPLGPSVAACIFWTKHPLQVKAPTARGAARGRNPAKPLREAVVLDLVQPTRSGVGALGQLIEQARLGPLPHPNL
jgi:hypothetical protein